MSNEKDRISTDEAKAALDTIGSMKQIGLQRSEHPRWFAISIALTIFLYFATIPFLFPLFLAFLGLYLLMSTKLGVKPSYSSPGAWTSLAWFAALNMFYLCVVYSRETYGLIWAPYAGGVIATSIYYIRYEVGKRTRAEQRTKEETP